MKKCRGCHRQYDEIDVEEMLEAIFGSRAFVDEDYLVLTYGLCPECWPEYF